MPPTITTDVSFWPLVSWEWRNGKENGSYYDGLYRDCYKNALLHSQLTNGKVLGGRHYHWFLAGALSKGVTL